MLFKMANNPKNLRIRKTKKKTIRWGPGNMRKIRDIQGIQVKILKKKTFIKKRKKFFNKEYLKYLKKRLKASFKLRSKLAKLKRLRKYLQKQRKISLRKK